MSITNDENLVKAAEMNQERDYSTESDNCLPSLSKEDATDHKEFQSENMAEDNAIERTHERNSAFSADGVTDSRGMNKVSSAESALMTIRCNKHSGEVIKLYCRRHDVVCCCICKALHHGPCTDSDIKYIPDVACGIDRTEDTKKVLQSMALIRDTVNDFRKLRMNELVQLDVNKNGIIQEIRQFKQKIVKKMEKLEKASIEEVIKRHKALSRKISTDIAVMDNMIQKLEQECDIMAEHSGNSADLYILLNTAKSNIGSSSKSLQDLQANAERVELFYTLHYGIESFFRELEKLGELIKPVDVVETKSYDVKLREDRNTCQITDVTILQDDTIVIADYENEKIKRLGQDFRVKQTFSIAGGPCGIAATGENEVVVSLTLNKRLQFVRFGWLRASLGDCIDVNEYCRGVTYSNYSNKIYVACGGGNLLNEGPGELRTYDHSGSCLKVYNMDQFGNLLLKHPVHMALSDDSSKLFVTDSKKGLVVIGYKGNKLYEVSVPFIKEASGVCVLDDERVIITGKVSCNTAELVKQENNVYRMMSEVTMEDGNPVSLAYMKSTDKVVIVSQNTDQICVKQLKLYK